MVNENDMFCSSGMQSANMLGDGMSEGMIMYMDGFRFSLSTSEKNPCLNLYFPSWTLNTRSKFLWAMLGVVLLGIVTEGVSKLRYTLSRRLTGMTKRWIMSLLHGVQALVGYILMLATMTFSVELLACVILGLGTGFAIFYDDDDDNHVTTNPVGVLTIFAFPYRFPSMMPLTHICFV
jgi:Ctr copper transporter family